MHWNGKKNKTKIRSRNWNALCTVDVKEVMIKSYTAEIEKQRKQLLIAKKYLSLIKRNVSVGSLAYTYVENAKTEIKELDKWKRYTRLDL